MRYIVLIFLFVSYHLYDAQHYFFGDIQTNYLLENQLYRSESNSHTTVKPYNFNAIQKNSLHDSVFQKGIWDYAETFANHQFRILPILGFEFQNNPINRENLLVSGLGLQINADFHERLSFQGRYMYNGGTIDNYFINSLHYRSVHPINGAKIDTVNNYRFHDLDLSLSFKANDYILLSLGKGKNFWGDGYRSLLLSDNAAAYPFFRIESEFWNVKYVNLYSMHQDQYFNETKNNKFASSHMLSWNITKCINLSVFESIVWVGKDTLSNRNFDVNYVNPIIFFRPVEYSIGSSDNSFLGASLKFKVFKSHILYGQILFDEFYLKELRAANGWWANKYGIQLGYKTFDLLNIKGLGLQAEFNTVRPFTYSHASSLQNYGHNSQSLVHPLESNFNEFLVRAMYQKNNFSFSFQYTYQLYGTDYMNYNFGGDMFLSYSTRFQDYNNTIAQGRENIVQFFGTSFSYMLFPKTNSKISLLFDYRSKNVQSNFSDDLLIRIGIHSNLWNTYADY